MSTFTRAGLYLIGALCLMVGPAWAESVPYTATWRSQSSFNLMTNASHFATHISGSSNAFGKYTCTGGNPATPPQLTAEEAESRCGAGYAAFPLDGNVYTCSAEGLSYPFTLRADDGQVQCFPLRCYNAEPPPFFTDCTYPLTATRTITGGDGETHGVTGSVTSTDTITILPSLERIEGDFFIFGATATSQGTMDIEFIEDEEPMRGFNLEIPAPDSTVNGVGIISGWSCLGGELKAEIIDAGEVVDTVVLNHGSSRTDTEGVCGDSNNGFSATVNWNHYAQGAKTIRLIRNGEEAESNEFSILRLSDDEFLTGASGMCVVNNFPDAGQDTTIEWDESRQGFFPTGIRDSQ